jgi:hypothetical protein
LTPVSYGRKAWVSRPEGREINWACSRRREGEYFDVREGKYLKAGANCMKRTFMGQSKPFKEVKMV